MDLGGTVASGGSGRPRWLDEVLCVAASGVGIGGAHVSSWEGTINWVSVTVRRSTEVRVHDMLGPQCGKLETQIRILFFLVISKEYIFFQLPYISDV